MKIFVSALTCNPSAGSEATVAYHYCTALMQRYEVTICTETNQSPPKGAEVMRVILGSFEPNDIDALTLLRFELAQNGLRQAHKRVWDVVHRLTPCSRRNPPLLLGKKTPLVVGPLLSTESIPKSFWPFAERARPNWLFEPLDNLRDLRYRLCSLLAFRSEYLQRARLIIAGSRTAIEQLPAKLYDKTTYIPFSGIDTEIFRPGMGSRKEGPLRLLYVGRIVQYKGLELLLHAVGKASRHVDLMLSIAGSAASMRYLHYCQGLVKNNGMRDDQIIFLGRLAREKLPTLYQSHDVFCFPTLYDTYGVSLLEAMSSGLSVIVSDISGPRDIVEDGTGVKIKMYNPAQYVQDMSNAIVRLAKDESMRQSLGRAARALMERKHRWEKIEKDILEAYEQHVA